MFLTPLDPDPIADDAHNYARLVDTLDAPASSHPAEPVDLTLYEIVDFEREALDDLRHAERFFSSMMLICAGSLLLYMLVGVAIAWWRGRL